MKAIASSAPCPGCGELMLQLLDVPGVMAVCRQCGGFWLDVVASTALLRNKLPEAVREFAKAYVAEHARRARSARSVYREAEAASKRCPECRVDLAQTTTTDPVLTLDICADHGTYFDERELATMVTTQEVRRLVPEIVVSPEQAQRIREAARLSMDALASLVREFRD